MLVLPHTATNDSKRSPGSSLLTANASEMHPTPLAFPVAQMVMPAEIYLAGFRDCTAQTVRYLIEQENLSADDPLIAGLHGYLSHQERHLVAPQLVIPSSCPTLPPTHQHAYPQFSPNGNDVNAVNAYAWYNGVTAQPTRSDVVAPVNRTLGFLHCQQPATVFPIQDSFKDTLHMQNDCNMNPQHQVNISSSSSSEVDCTDIETNAKELALLAENNPQIGNLLEELFELFDEEDEEDDEEEESMDDSLEL